MGNCVAKLFAREGATVILLDINEKVRDCVEAIKTEGFDAAGFEVNLAKLDEVVEIAGRIMDSYGQIDILANVAGKSIPPRPPFLEMSEDYWNLVLDNNLRTTVNCCWAVLPHMVECKYGKVINFSSVTGTKYAYRYSAAYAASKGAVSGLTRALALEMGEYNITVNAILPGDVDTGDQPWSPANGRRDLGFLSDYLSPPLTRPGRAEEVAELTLFLATDESRFITGAEIVIDGGSSIVEPYPQGPE
jgi:NAD(P)-dependent dehydrogenase (short-subunit alcohol dehydrogenase family)